MSSGHPEGPSTNPDDWKSPYTGPNQTPGYGAPSGYEPPQQEPQTTPGQPGYPPNHDQGPAYGQSPTYDQGAAYGQGQAHGQGQGYGQDPGQAYGQGQGYAPGQGYGEQPPHGQYPPPYAQGYGPTPQPGSDSARTHAIVALAISLVFALSCFVSLGGVAGAIMSGIALGKVDHDVRGAKRLLRWTWISIGINFALIFLGIATFIIAGINGAFDSY